MLRFADISSVGWFGVQAFWFFRYERDPAAKEDAAEGGTLHVSDGLRLRAPDDLAMATLLGVALEAQHGLVQQQQRQPRQSAQIHAIVRQADGQQVPMQWPSGRCLGMGSTSQVYEATVLGSLAAVKIPVDPEPDDTESMRAECLERLQCEIDMLTGPLKHLQGTVVPRVLAFGVLADPPVPVLAVELLEPLSEWSRLRRHEEDALCAQLQDIHAAGVLHNDLRSDMIFRARLGPGSSPSFRISDFSHSSLHSDDGSYSSGDYELGLLKSIFERRQRRHGPVQPSPDPPTAPPADPNPAAGGRAAACSSSSMRTHPRRQQQLAPSPVNLGLSVRRVRPAGPAHRLPGRLPSNGFGTIRTRLG